MDPAIDHLVIGAATLEQGVAYVKQHLGVNIPFGGVHTTMGTHNHLMQLGQDLFLEVIAINADGAAVKQPRWYGLDDPFVRQQIEHQPRLLTWVINTRNIDALMRRAICSFGKSTRISRGDLSWDFSLPEDGRLLAAGLLPYIIQWQADTHPANRLQDRDCVLRHLSLYHANASWLKDILDSISAHHLVDIHPIDREQAPYIEAQINTPSGLKILSSKF